MLSSPPARRCASSISAAESSSTARLPASRSRRASTRARTYRSTPPSTRAELQNQVHIHTSGAFGAAMIAVRPSIPSTKPTVFVKRVDAFHPIPSRGPRQNRQLGRKPSRCGRDINPPPELLSTRLESSSEDVTAASPRERSNLSPDLTAPSHQRVCSAGGGAGPDRSSPPRRPGLSPSRPSSGTDPAAPSPARSDPPQPCPPAPTTPRCARRPSGSPSRSSARSRS